jgi:hypothetical protein
MRRFGFPHARNLTRGACYNSAWEGTFLVFYLELIVVKDRIICLNSTMMRVCLVAREGKSHSDIFLSLEPELLLVGFRVSLIAYRYIIIHRESASRRRRFS